MVDWTQSTNCISVIVVVVVAAVSTFSFHPTSFLSASGMLYMANAVSHEGPRNETCRSYRLSLKSIIARSRCIVIVCVCGVVRVVVIVFFVLLLFVCFLFKKNVLTVLKKKMWLRYLSAE